MVLLFHEIANRRNRSWNFVQIPHSYTPYKCREFSFWYCNLGAYSRWWLSSKKSRESSVDLSKIVHGNTTNHRFKHLLLYGMIQPSLLLLCCRMFALTGLLLVAIQVLQPANAWGGLFNRFSPEMLSNLGYGSHGSFRAQPFLQVGLPWILFLFQFVWFSICFRKVSATPSQSCLVYCPHTLSNKIWSAIIY